MPTEASLRDALFHFSEDPAIRVFEPRAVRVPAERAAGMAWLNGPLVWAIAAPFQALYLFPRDCPRIVILRKPKSSEADLARWFGSSNSVAVAYVEQDWMDRIAATPLYRYDLPPASF